MIKFFYRGYEIRIVVDEEASDGIDIEVVGYQLGYTVWDWHDWEIDAVSGFSDFQACLAAAMGSIDGQPDHSDDTLVRLVGIDAI